LEGVTKVRVDSRKIANSTVLSAVIVALLMLLATHLVLSQVRREEIAKTATLQQNALKTFRELLKAKGSAFQVRDGQLLDGAYRLNGANEFPDKVSEITGVQHATIFQGDTRIATNILQGNGLRALGTRLTGPAYDAIFRQGISFRGEALVLGVSYFTAYDPLRDPGGKIIGALFVGSKENDYLAAYNRLSFSIHAISGVMTCILIVCAVLLLSERKRSENAIQKQLQFLQVIIDAIPTPVFYKNAQGKFLGFNRSYEEMRGLSGDQMLGKTVHDIWNKDQADHFRQKDQELFEGSDVQSYESSIRYPDGTLRDTITNKAVFRDRDGAIGGVVGVIFDITERKAAEEEARDAYRRIADILEFLPDATFVVDRAGRVIAWNRAIEIMTEVPKAEILGKGDYAYAIPFYGEPRSVLIDLLDEDLELPTSSYPGVTRNGKTLCAEKKVLLHGREERYLWSIAAPLYDRQGNQVGGIQTLRDMTELRRAEQERGALEAQLHNSSMMESLMVQLGHDLKTPLTPLFAMLPLVRRKVADPGLERMLDICLSCVSQIQGLTDKALDLVRLSSKAAATELAPVRLSAVAAQSINGCEALFSKRGISCFNGIDPALTVQGAEAQLLLLFDNLLSNAARFAAENGEVRIAALPKDGAVLVSVQDDGIGLEPGHQMLIFDEFFKADAARHDPGTQGLGLAISKSIALNHRGKIWAESPGRNRGTTIFFTLQPTGRA
jgi:PAS domain S-box-containing protein